MATRAGIVRAAQLSTMSGPAHIRRPSSVASTREPPRGPNGPSHSFLGDLGDLVIDVATDVLIGDNGPGGGGGGVPGSTGLPPVSTTTPLADIAGGTFGKECPPGTFNVFGTCLDLQPGGETQGEGFVVPNGSSGMSPVAGRYGPAYRPSQVGTVNGRPIRRCVPGMVLGRDNLCYEKRAISRSERKWPKAAKPPITVGDAKAIRQADRAKKRVKKLAGDVGFSCKKR